MNGVERPLPHARSHHELNQLVEHIHDRWFDTEQILVDKSTLQIPFLSRDDGQRIALDPDSGKPIEDFDRVLVVRRVSDVQLEDPSQIGIYMFNTLTYDPSDQVLQFTAEPGGFRIDVHVEEVDVEVRDWAA